jgi:plastocyanin
VSGGWRRRAVVLGWALAVAAAGAAGGRASRAGAKPVTHTVTIDATRYEPSRLVVRPGDTIVWVNKDLIPHTATATGGAWDSKAVPAGASWRLTIEAKGATDYSCLFHPTMIGRIEAR